MSEPEWDPLAMPNPIPEHLDCSDTELRWGGFRESSGTEEPARIWRAAELGGTFYVLDVAGRLAAIDLRDGTRRRVQLGGWVQDLRGNGHKIQALVRSRESPNAPQELWQKLPGSAWQLLAELPYPSCAWQSVLGFAGPRSVSVGRANMLFSLSSTGNWEEHQLPVSLNTGRRESKLACSDDGLCFLAVARFEIPAWLAFLDLRTKKSGVASWQASPNTLCTTELRQGIRDRFNPGCVLLAQGYWGRSATAGCVVRACRSGVNQVFSLPAKGTRDPKSTLPVVALVQVGRDLIVQAEDNLYRVRGAKYEQLPVPTFQELGGIGLSNSIPGLLIVARRHPRPWRDPWVLVESDYPLP